MSSSSRRAPSELRRGVQTAQPPLPTTSTGPTSPQLPALPDILPIRHPSESGETLLCNFPIFFNTPMPIPYYSNVPNLSPTPCQFKYLLFTGFCAINGILPQNVISEETPTVTVEINLVKDISLPIPDVVTPVAKLQNNKRSQKRTKNSKVSVEDTPILPSLNDFPPFDPAKMSLGTSSINGGPLQYCLYSRPQSEIADMLPLVPQLTPINVHQAPVRSNAAGQNSKQNVFKDANGNVIDDQIIPFYPEQSRLDDFQDYGCSATISFNITNQARFDEVFTPILQQVRSSVLSNPNHYPPPPSPSETNSTSNDNFTSLSLDNTPSSMNDELPKEITKLRPHPLSPSSIQLSQHNIPQTALLVSFCGHSFRLYQSTTRPSIFKLYSLTYDLARSYSGELLQAFFQRGHITPEEAYKSFPNQYHTFSKPPFVNISLYDPSGSVILTRKTGVDHYNYGVSREPLINKLLAKRANYDSTRPLLTQLDSVTQPILVNAFLSVKGGIPGVLQHVPTYPQLTRPGANLGSPSFISASITPSSTSNMNDVNLDGGSNTPASRGMMSPLTSPFLPPSTSRGDSLSPLNIDQPNQSTTPTTSSTSITQQTPASTSTSTKIEQLQFPHPNVFIGRSETTTDRVSTALIASISLPKNNVMPYHDTAHLFPTPLLFQHAEPDKIAPPPLTALTALPSTTTSTALPSQSTSTPDLKPAPSGVVGEFVGPNGETLHHNGSNFVFLSTDGKSVVLNPNTPNIQPTSSERNIGGLRSGNKIAPTDHFSSLSAQNPQAAITSGEATGVHTQNHQLYQPVRDFTSVNNVSHLPSHLSQPLSNNGTQLYPQLSTASPNFQSHYTHPNGQWKSNPNPLTPNIPATDHPRALNGVQYVNKQEYILNKGLNLDITQTSFYQLDPQLTTQDLDAQYYKLLTNLDSQVGLYKDVIQTINTQHKQLMTYSSSLLNQQAQILSQLQTSQMSFIEQQKCMNNVLYKLIPPDFFSKAYQDTNFDTIAASYQNQQPTSINIIQPRQVVDLLHQHQSKNPSTNHMDDMVNDEIYNNAPTNTKRIRPQPDTSKVTVQSIVEDKIKDQYNIVDKSDNKAILSNTDTIASLLHEHSDNMDELLEEAVLIDDFEQLSHIQLTHDQMVQLLCLRELNKSHGLPILPQSVLQTNVNRAAGIVQTANDLEMERTRLEFDLINQENCHEIELLTHKQQHLTNTVESQQLQLHQLHAQNEANEKALQQRQQQQLQISLLTHPQLTLDPAPTHLSPNQLNTASISTAPTSSAISIPHLTTTSNINASMLPTKDPTLPNSSSSSPKNATMTFNNSTLPQSLSSLSHDHDNINGYSLNNDLNGIKTTKRPKLIFTGRSTDSNITPSALHSTLSNTHIENKGGEIPLDSDSLVQLAPPSNPLP